jgi:uracil phosphoribosyltransferase
LPPGLAASVVLLADPMLATGGSAVAAVNIIKGAGVRNIRMMSVVAAPEGVAAMTAAHPDVHIFSPALDGSLNAKKFIVPGLGDFGDRLYGTI